MGKRIVLVLVMVVILSGCTPNNRYDINETTENLNNTDISSDKLMEPDKLYSYGTHINIERCINVEGDIEYLPNIIPYEYEGENVRYYCESSFEYVFENGYEKDCIECMVMLYFNNQYIPFSIDNGEYLLTHTILANNKGDDSNGTYVIDFEFSFIPYGLEISKIEKFNIILVPLYPLNVEDDGEEAIDLLPISVAGMQGQVISSGLNCDYIEYTSIGKEATIIPKDKVDNYITELSKEIRRGISDIECFILEKDNNLENTIVYKSSKEMVDVTITTIAICDNKIMSAFNKKNILSTCINENSVIVANIDLSGIEKGKHSIYTVTIIKDNIYNTQRIYRTNFINIDIN